MEGHLEEISKLDTIALRKRYIGQSCTLFYKSDPLKVLRAKGQYMYDENGKQYLDCINNVAHVGHCNPEVVRAGQRQLALLATNSRFLHDSLVMCAKRLTSTLPDKLSVCFLVNSGSEANDLAIRLAEIYTGNTDTIVLQHAYHGHLTSMIDISPYKFNSCREIKRKQHVHVTSCPDIYRGKYQNRHVPHYDLGAKYADDVSEICNRILKNDRGVSAFIAESLLSVGGQIIPPNNFFKEAYRYIRGAGGVCIADEVQVGFGRVGKYMWAFQAFGEDVIPDIITMGKPMGNGHPVAAVITTQKIANCFYKTGIEYFNTYGGNPVSCAIANAVMDVLCRQKLQDNAMKVGYFLIKKLHKLSTRHPIIGDVRGFGLFLGVELIKDREQKTPATVEASIIVNKMRDHGILLSSEGPNYNILKVKPPMVFTYQNANFFVAMLDTILQEL